MPEPTHRPEVLEELVGLAVRANADRSHADLCGCATWPERCASGYIPGEWEHGDEAHTIAAVLPAHERQVREQVARDIEANPMNECSGAVAECARIARGTDPADPPDPRLSELTTRAAAIDLPSEEPDITDALRRIRRDIRLALTSRYDPHANPAADLERELGNMIVSSLRWMRVYGLDPLTCIETAERVQRERAEREGR